MSVKALVKLVPPPLKPVSAGTAAGWKDVETRLGLELPPDYKEIVNLYGVGWFGNWICVYSPFDETFNLFAQGERYMSSFREWLATDDPDNFPPYPIYPENGGLLSFAQDENAGPYCYVTEGPAQDWPILIMDNKYLRDDSRQIDATLSELLAGWFSGEYGTEDHETLEPPLRNEFVPGPSADYSWYK